MRCSWGFKYLYAGQVAALYIHVCGRASVSRILDWCGLSLWLPHTVHLHHQFPHNAAVAAERDGAICQLVYTMWDCF